MSKLISVENKIKSSPLESARGGQEQWQGCVSAISLSKHKHTPPPLSRGESHSPSFFSFSKLMMVLAIIICSTINAKAQHAGYSRLTDLTKFKQQFAEVAQKTMSIKSDFTQEKNLGMLSEKITSKGKFWYKKTNMLRMEYTQPFSYLMILNKDNVFIKDGQKENKVSTRSNKVFKQINKIVIDCIQGTALNSGDFKSAVYENKGTYLVSLSPTDKQLSDFFKTIEITVDKKDYSVNNIEMLESSGDSTILHFTNKEINANIPDALFAIK
jgi:outer membrane lipoprotein-sorting protein